MANAFTLFGEISVDTAKLDSELKKAEQSLNRTAGAFGKAEGAARSAAKGNDAFANSTKNANKATAAMGDKLQMIGGGFQSAGVALSAGLTAPIVASTYKILQAGTTYEKSMAVFRVATNATADEMARASQIAKQLGADTSLPATSAADAGAAMVELGKAGMTAAQAMDSTRGVLLLAAAAGIQEAQAAEITANALNSFSLAASESTRVADLLAGAANASSADIGDLAQGLTQSSAVFAAAKMPVEDLTTALAAMANAGIKGSDAGTSLKTFLASIQAPTDAAASAMQQLGVAVRDDVTKEMLPLEDIIGNFSSALATLDPAAQADMLRTIFGADAIRAAQILFKTGEQGFAKLKEAVTETGSASKLAQALASGLGGSWDALTSQLETVGLEIFESIKEPLNQVLKVIKSFVEIIGNAFTALPAPLKLVAAGIAGIVALAGPVLLFAGTIMSMAGSIAAGVAALGGLAAIKVAVVGALAVAIPVIVKVGLVLAALAAAAALVYAAFQSNFGNLKTIVTDAVGRVQAVVESAKQTILQFWAENGAAIMQAAGVIQKHVMAVVTVISGVLIPVFQSIFETAGQVFRGLLNIVSSVFAGVWGILSNGVMVIVNLINGEWQLAFNAFANIVISAVNLIIGAIGGLIRVGLAPIMGFVKTLASYLPASMAQMANDFADGFDKNLKVFEDGIPLLETSAKQAGDTMTQASADAINAGAPAVADATTGMMDGVKKALTDGGQKAVDVTKATGKDLQKALTDLANNTNLSADLRKRLTTEAKKIGDDMSKAMDASKQKAVKSTQGLIDSLNNILKNPQVSDTLKKAVGDEIARLQKVLEDAKQPIAQKTQDVVTPPPAVAASAKQNGKNVGDAVVQGILQGMNPQPVYQRGFLLGKESERGFRDAVESRSPSKVFRNIGKDVVQGFIDGINMMKASANAALAAMIAPETLGKLLQGKAGSKMLEFLTPIVQEMAKLKDETYSAQFNQLLLAGAFGKLTPELKKGADAIAAYLKEVDRIKKENKENEDAVKKAADAYSDLKGKLLEIEPVLKNIPTDYEVLRKALGDYQFLTQLSTELDMPIEKLRNLLEMRAKLAALELPGRVAPNLSEMLPKAFQLGSREKIEIFPLPDVGPWDSFFDHIKKRMGEWSNETKDMGKVLGTVLTDSLGKAADIFASAVANWDGTWKGFVKSIASGFRSLAQQIIQQLIQIAIMRVMAGLGLGAASGAGGYTYKGVSPGGLTTVGPRGMAGVPAMPTFATGGLVSGPGTAMSDSIPAMLSNGEFVIPASSVRRFGVDFFESLRKGQMPMRRYAMGGMVTPTASSVSTSNSTSNYNNVFNIAVPSGSNQQQTAAMVQSQILAALRKHEQRNK